MYKANDANFGILKRDIDIVRYVAEKKGETGKKGKKWGKNAEKTRKKRGKNTEKTRKKCGKNAEKMLKI